MNVARCLPATLAALCLAALVACGGEPEATVPPPVAGLRHPAIARVGEAVQFSAAPTAVAKFVGEGAPPAGTRIVRFELHVADGSAAVAAAGPTFAHSFASAGTFAVQLTVVDDAGRSSRADSTIAIAADHGALCSDGDVDGCASGRCDGGVCVVLACAGAPACPDDLVCDGGACVVTAAGRGGRRFGADGGRTPLDAGP